MARLDVETETVIMTMDEVLRRERMRVERAIAAKPTPQARRSASLAARAVPVRSSVSKAKKPKPLPYAAPPVRSRVQEAAVAVVGFSSFMVLVLGVLTVA